MKNLFLTKTRWLVTIFLLLFISIENAWADLEITYGESTTGWTITDKEWGSSYWGLCNQNNYCIISPTISDLSQVTEVQVYARTYGTTSNNSNKIGVWSGSTRIGSQATATNSYAEYKFTPSSLTGSGTIKVRSDGTATGAGLRVTRVTIVMAATYTLKLPKGDGTYATTTTTSKSDLDDGDIPFSGADCGGEALDGTFVYYWVTSAIPAGSAVSSMPSTKYNSYNVPTYDITLYPLFQNAASKYHTAPPCEESCTNTVSVSTGASTNCSVSVSSASVATCSSTASDRYVTVSVTPASCFAGPTDATIITKSGTTATLVSGPTLNSDHYDYVYSFAQNATGTATFSASLSSKTTYTIQYNAGSTTHTGGNAISGSHANDTKTCGTNLTLPGVTFTTTGYTQTGWTKTDGGSKTNNLGGSYSSDAAQVFYPAWTANKYTVTWKVNNTNYSAGGSTEVTHGNHVATLPTPPNPASYCGQRFMGWTTSEVVTPQAAAPSPLYTEASQFPNATGNQVFHAVFADYDE